MSASGSIEFARQMTLQNHSYKRKPMTAHTSQYSAFFHLEFECVNHVDEGIHLRPSPLDCLFEDRSLTCRGKARIRRGGT